MYTQTVAGMEALLGRVARLGAGVAGAAFVGNNFLFNGARPVP